MPFSSDQQEVLDAVKSDPDMPILVQGEAGTGKSLLRDALAKARPSIILGPTGMSIAGVDSDGYTLAKFLGASCKSIGSAGAMTAAFRPPYTAAELATKQLIIDEISMVSVPEYIALDAGLRKLLRNDTPFGGLRVIHVGDLLQLTPPGSNRMFFETRPYRDLLHQGLRTFLLSTQHRQSDTDPEAADEFRHLLKHMRFGTLGGNANALGTLLYGCNRRSALPGAIHLYATRAAAARHNAQVLATCDGFTLTLTPTATRQTGNPLPDPVHLKEGARVSLTRNIYTEGRMIAQNGAVGTVVKVPAVDTVYIARSKSCKSVEVLLDGGTTIHVRPVERAEYDDSRTKMLWREWQYPLVLAFALSIHRAQGQTYDAIVVHGEGMFEPQQAYVAASRCRTLAGLSCDNVLPEHFNFKMRDALVRFLAGTLSTAI